jgi:transposase
VPIRLSRGERQVLQARAARARAEQRDVLRARIVLAAANGLSNAVIAARLGVTDDTVRKWRGRFAAGGLACLDDLPRSGRPRLFAPAVAAEVKALACSLPAEQGLPLSAWTCAELAQEAVARGVARSLSASTVRRILSEDVIKPWQCRSWIFPRDPDFGPKAGRVLDLYARRWKGRRLGEDEYVISADEKSQLQALRRCHPDVPAGPGRARRQEFEYHRAGTLAYFAALDVHHGQVMGRCAPKTGIEPFSELVEQVMTAEPYASARRVFWVVDNGSSHNGARSIQRMSEAFANATLVHLPVHASWLNQVEIFFSIVQRKVVKPQDFPDLPALEQRLLAFQNRHNQTAQPFDWRYTRQDLKRYLARLAAHETAA